METIFSIADISKRTGLSYDTIRYYEKIGLMPPAKRTGNGQREYDQLALNRFTFIARLKRTHMPLKDIERYLTLAAAQNYEACYTILHKHKQEIEAQAEDINATLQEMSYKLNHFEALMARSGLGGDGMLEGSRGYTITAQEPISSGFGAGTTASEVLAGQDLSGRIAIVTGGYSGVGLETTRALAEAGATVIVPVRTPSKASASIAGIPRVELEELDLFEPASIDAFAQRFLGTGRQLDMLINNAGIMAPPLVRDARGYESQFATNHLGHFQLTARLWPALKQAGHARVVSVSSTGVRFGGVDFEDPNFERQAYDKWKAYGQSKSANALFAVALDRLGYTHGVRAFSVHPGRIMTDLVRHLSEEEKNAASGEFKSTAQGAATSVWCAASPQLEGKGGVYCMDCDIANIIPGEALQGLGQVMAGVLPWAVDPGLAERLWKLSESMTGVTFDMGVTLA
ncbi:oxidoreductase [Paenibacillus sp. R14(2021)]|uniref:oxidoreductase n=1 Tax=Paenibacillus sp. R14(2021) TaxID=2859228 RepID=UPI00280A4F9B|nr:oxidoreductase [Paenibacillus sp. R14(2021)]